MPVRNAGDYLIAAVSSILAQEDVEFELILIDDGSTDVAINNLQSSTNDSRLRFVNNHGAGLIDALNTGLQVAKGDIIARMDADDIAHPKRLLIQQHYLQSNPQVDVCGSQVEIFSANGIADGYSLYEKWINSLQSDAEIKREFFIESPIAHPSAMFRRSLIDKIGGYQSNGWPEDYDLWCRALLAGARFGKPAGAALLRWRDYPDRTSRTKKMYHKHAFLACKASYLTKYLKANNVASGAIWGTGPTGLRFCRLLEQEQFAINEFYDINEQMRGRYKRGLPVRVCPLQKADKSVVDMLRQFKLADRILIVAVSVRGARQQMRDYLLRAELVEQSDFLFIA